MLEVDDLRVTYGGAVEALRGVSLVRVSRPRPLNLGVKIFLQI